MLSAVIIFLIVGLIAVEILAARREAAARRDYPAEGQILDVGGVAIHAVVTGQGPDLVLIHGASGNTRDMTFDLAGRLSDRYRVIVFDRPGLGYSGRADVAYNSLFAATGESPTEQARLLQQAAAQLGAERPLVLGHSFGGAVALAWALDRPDTLSAVIDVAGVAMPWPGELDRYYRVLGTSLGGAIVPPLITALVSRSHVKATIGAIFAPDPPPRGYTNAVGASLTIRRESLRANARQVNSLYDRVVEMSARYGSLDLPIEIVHGDLDVIVPLAIHSIPLSQIAPQANLTVIEGAGHMPHHTHTEIVIAAIDRAADRAGLR